MDKFKKIISEEVYLDMKKYIAEYESNKLKSTDLSNDIEQPYFVLINIETEYKYNPKFGDDRICKCGHTYYRHFDSYEQMEAVGCKYCRCYLFEEAE